MKDTLKYLHIDHVLNLFYGFVPYGVDYFKLTYKLNYAAEEWEDMFDFLIKENLIEPWGDDEKQIITEKGIEIITKHNGIEDYLKNLKKRNKT